MAKTATRSVDLEPIDRLEEKLKRLVGMIEQMRIAQARSAEENQRLTREIGHSEATAPDEFLIVHDRYRDTWDLLVRPLSVEPRP